MKALNLVLCAGTLLLGIVQGDSIQDVFDTMDNNPSMRVKRAPATRTDPFTQDVKDIGAYLMDHLNGTEYVYHSDGGTILHEDGYTIRYNTIPTTLIKSSVLVKEIPELMSDLVIHINKDKTFGYAFTENLYIQYNADDETNEVEKDKNGKKFKNARKLLKAKTKSGKSVDHKPYKDFIFYGVPFHPRRANNQWVKRTLYNESKPGDWIHDNVNISDWPTSNEYHKHRNAYLDFKHKLYDPQGIIDSTGIVENIPSKDDQPPALTTRTNMPNVYGSQLIVGQGVPVQSYGKPKHRVELRSGDPGPH
ncbi:hypothetical protein HDU86_007569 [Geranomyces michiganensis]|nr:hypothetical protein HDU86_007569 [Geranomyces michiganensis]